MTDKEILTRSIKEALLNGYKFVREDYEWEAFGEGGRVFWPELSQDKIWFKIKKKDGFDSWIIPVREVIFRKEFAKAFWKSKESELVKTLNSHLIMLEVTKVNIREESLEHAEFIKEIETTRDRITELENGLFSWEYHLQQMVLEDNPIKYLEQFL